MDYQLEGRRSGEAIKVEVDMRRSDEIYIHDELVKRGKLSLISDVSPEIFREFRQDLLWCVSCSSLEKVDVEICSPGGCVFHGFAIYDLIRYCQMEYGVPINTIGNGYMASMGSVLFQAGSWRMATRNSWMMIHEVSTLTWGDEKSSFIEDEHKLLKRLQTKLVDIYSQRSTLTKKKIEANWKRKDWWLDADEMLELGLCDEIIDTRWEK